MTRRNYIILFLLGVGVTLIVAVFQHAPGYMDADYYFAGGLRLATGHGFTEPFLWNFLDDPAGLPHPSHAYWMPLASLLAAIGIKLSGITSFNTARIGFLVLAGFLPPLTAHLSFSLTSRRDHAILAGILAAVPAFYLSYLGTTDTFGIYMFLGGLFLLLVAKDNCEKMTSAVNLQKFVNNGGGVPFLLGIVAGLMHLARADGVVWLLIGLITVGSRQSAGKRRLSPITPYVSRFLLIIAGYLLIMGPWMARNYSVFNTPLSPGGVRALWLTNYDEVYSYPSTILTPARWWASGLGYIIRARLEAMGQNLQNSFVVQGEIFLAPLILLGLWRLRFDTRVRLGIAAWFATMLMMTVLFPYPGTRGGFFHSSAALQPLFWAVAPVGLDEFVSWGVRIRGWQPGSARSVFRGGLVGLALMLTVLVVHRKVIGDDFTEPAWGRSAATYAHLEEALGEVGASPKEIVLVNNPPGYYIAAKRSAIAIPNGDETVLLAAAERYQVGYLLLEFNHPRDLNDLYNTPEGTPGLDYLLTVDETHVFRIDIEP